MAEPIANDWNGLPRGHKVEPHDKENEGEVVRAHPANGREGRTAIGARAAMKG